MNEQEFKILIERLRDELVPVGCIMCYASPNCPDGYLPCDGRELMQSQYPVLFKVIGNIFGGSSKTFCLPDLQGQFIRGWDKEGNTDPDASDRKFGEPQKDAIQGHNHILDKRQININIGVSGEHSHTVKASITQAVSWGSVNMIKWLSSGGGDSTVSSKEGSHTHSVTINCENAIREPISSTSGVVSIATETRPKNLALLYCIKVK